PLFFVPFRIFILNSFPLSRSLLRNGTKTTTATGAEAARAAARLRSRDRAAARHRKLLARRLRRDLARRSERSDRHESAEPLWRVRRQARALPRHAQALLGTQPPRDRRSARLRSDVARGAAAPVSQGSGRLFRRQGWPSRLLRDRHGD